NPSSYWYGRTRPAFWNDVGTLPLGYPLERVLQVLCQPVASIMSKEWLRDFVDPLAQSVGCLGEWIGYWNNWTLYWRRSISCVDVIPVVGLGDSGVVCGTGPFILDRLNWTSEWSIFKFDDYWRGWPSPFPHPPYPDSSIPPACIRPKGWLENVTVRQKDTDSRITDLKGGFCDMAAIPRYRVGELHVNGDPYGPTLEGIRLYFPIPVLSLDSLHFTFNIEPTLDNRYGTIYPEDELHEDGIPRNFFSNSNVRKAFAHLINFTWIIQNLLIGEGYQPCTFAPTGLPYVYCNVTKYTYDLDLVAYYFKNAQFGGVNLTDVGFSVIICYNEGNEIREAIAEQLATSGNIVGEMISTPSKIHFWTKGVQWEQYNRDMDDHFVPCFFNGWQADYAHVRNFAFSYAHSKGAFPRAQRYSNSTIDELLDETIYLPSGSSLSQIYNDVMIMFYQDVPTVPLFVVMERIYSRDWVHGWYHNPLYGASLTCINGFSLLPVYAYPLWKWRYIVGDVNFDGRVTMDDIIAIVNSFGSYACKAGMPVFHPKWNFYCDVDDSPRYRWRDRKIDMGDIINALVNFGKTSIPWQPPP
ncbi:MAG: hypothetical protein K6T73_04085, partial [Candidatus Bathyarchaeota archaeon]|nr:hypothetical protein [Candidatus Bathyarchaeota archaeon]